MCKTLEPSKHLRGISQGVGSFSLLEGLFKRAAKHHLDGRHCLAYIFERESQKSTLLAICSDTPAQLQSDECVRVVPSILNKVSINGLRECDSKYRENGFNRDFIITQSQEMI